MEAATGGERRLRQLVHQTIASVTGAFDQFGFNVAVARLYELANGLAEAQRSGAEADPMLTAVLREGVETLALLLAPMMPHLAEEVLDLLQPGRSWVAVQPWPVAEAGLLITTTQTIAVQVQGKLRAALEVAMDATAEAIFLEAERDVNVARALAGQRVVKRIYVPGRVVNFVLGGPA